MIECGKSALYRVEIVGKKYPQVSFFCADHLEKSRNLSKLYHWQLRVEKVDEILNHVCKVLIYSEKEK